MIMKDDINNINNQWKKTIEQLSAYKTISETTLEECDESFIETKKKICQDFDTIINYLTDRKIQLLCQLQDELESHKNELESNRDKSMMLIEQLNRKVNGLSGSLDSISGSSGKIGGGLTHSISYNGNLNQYLSASSGFASSPLNYSTSSLNNNNNNSNNISPLNKSTSFQTDYLQVLKESISTIEWEWVGEFQENNTTNTKIIKQTKPLSNMVTEILNDLLGDKNMNVEDLTQKFQDTENNSNNNTDKSEYNSNSNGNNKRIKTFGKLKFKTIENPEYKRLNSSLPDTKMIFSIGGKFQGGFDQYSIEKYDFKEELWRSLQPIPSIMDNDFTGNFDGKNHIYLFGGSISPTRVLKYNILEDQWYKIDSSGAGTGDIEIPEGGRFLHCSIFDEKQNIYLIGGFPRSTTFILKFSITTEQFTRQSSIPKNLWSIGSVYQSSNSSIYLVGGCNISRQSVDTFERYDIENDQFITLESLPIACYGAGVILDEQEHYIYVFGGYSSKDNKCLDLIQRYDLLENSGWEVLDGDNLRMPKSMMINGNSIIFDSSKRLVYILGGYNNVTKESIDSIYSLDLSNISDQTFWETNKINTFKNSKLKGGTSILIQK